MNTIIFNYLPDEIISEKHICFFTKDAEFDIELHEVKEVCIVHPKSGGMATISNIETRKIASFKRSSYEGSNTILLEAAQKACLFNYKRK